ncbi:C1GALT1-specific chaperone 1-like [Zophobas morio]|uniref:C1GALT1-specific chaperone 1-like n=1 Tax=Zophobas morio TaxID=2755281 RepID=UPI0030829ED7
MLRLLTKTSFLVGIFIGVFLAVLLKVNNKIKTDPEDPPRVFTPTTYNSWFKERKLARQQVPFDYLRYSNQTYVTESEYLYKDVPIFCVILVKSSKNAKAAQETWGRHCNHVLPINLSSDKKKIQIKRNNEGSSWVILCKMLKEVPEEFKWVLIVYDYTFVLVENLRLFLAGLNHKEKYYLGHTVKFWSTVYNMGQAGYVLSKGSVDSLKKKFNETDSCSKILTYRNQEDYYLGQNLAVLNITPVDTRDMNGLSTFHPYNLYHVFFPGDNYYRFSIYPHKCCSPYTIAFQAIEGDKMYTYYYLLYTVQLFHFGHYGNKPPIKTYADDEVWKNFLKERNIPENITPEQYYKVWENIVDDPTSFARHMKREEYFDYT